MRQNRKSIAAVSAVLVAIAFAAFLFLLNRMEESGEGAGRESAAAGELVNEEREDGSGESAQRLGTAKQDLSGDAGETAPATEPVAPKEAEQSLETDIPSLAETYADYFPIGAAIEPYQTTGLKAELLKKHVNWLVGENAMKPASLQPSEGNFQWDQADRIVAFAKENGMGVRFHTLVWHNQTPAWFFMDGDGKPMADETDPVKRKANKKLLLQRLDTHVRTIVERYKDDIQSWDVVNEVIEPGDPDGLRSSDWYKITGTDYLKTAFRAARKAGGPNIKLYINDYGTDDPAKCELLYELVKELLDEGVPIDGVGHQTHISIHWPSAASIIDSMRKFHELGLDNLVTELDMSLYAWNDRSDFGPDIPAEVLQKQADRYYELFEAFKANKEIIGGVVFWGIADDHTWLSSFPVKRTEAPLLFDKQLHAKPAFWALVPPSKRRE
ncbi:endo-1,4-beta-xylanase [Paenibacillus thermotolerans]|uniref:endo-1,4-beta-xylanase n=1 Tax=Paenibacillus thermotolerans TaxID=3027807 RepID=UPI0023689BA8|nr:MULTISPECIES: endo-1,4-beta-xylanase [unclassified Paenibacillus]